MGADDLAVVDERRQSLLAAKERLEAARTEAAKHANVYGKESAEKVRTAAQEVQLKASKKWYNFWEKASRVPKTLTLADGSSAAWDAVAKKALKEVSALASSETDFEGSSKKAGATVEASTTNVEKGVAMLRVTLDVGAEPRKVVLSQIRANLLGKCDPSLLYMREHYTFRGGKTSLFHKVHKYGPGFVSPRDFVVLQTWEEEEDGTITLAARSVDSIEEKVVPGAVRGSTLLFGMVIKPKEVTLSGFLGGGKTVDGSEVTVIQHQLLRGMVPAFFAKAITLSPLIAALQAVPAVISGVEKEGQLDELITNHVLYPEDAPEPEAEAEEAEPEPSS